jgi:protein-glutamine gamma-glutamyltransferase
MQFESNLRSNIVEAARDLSKGGTRFATFRTSFCNKQYWHLTNEGGFLLRNEVPPSVGIRDIFLNGPKYGFECATSIIIVLYKGVLDTIGDTEFDRLFPNLLLHSWYTDSDLGLTQDDAGSQYARPGDVLYFKNPEVNPDKMEWQGENVVKMGEDLYYGHGVGIKPATGIIAALNKNRVPGATVSAYLLDQVTYPDYTYLSQFVPANVRLYYNPAQRRTELGLANAVSARIGSLRFIKRRSVR